jgi:hypothetical protein
MRWSVSLEAETEDGRLLTHEEILELADAVAMSSGIASGIGTNRYGAQLVVEAGSRDEAMEKGTVVFVEAAVVAGLPQCPIVRLEAVSEIEDQAGVG